MKTSWKKTIQLTLFGKEPEPGRLIYLDNLRVLAAVFVICVHTVSLAATMVALDSLSFRVLEILNFGFLSCNLLFIMISGALLLPVRTEKASVFFAKRFSKVAVPLVIYYILYVCAKEGLEWLYPDHWFSMIKRILSGAPEEAPHFWLVYVILLLYMLTPFFRKILQNIPDSVLKGLMIVIFLVNAVRTYAPYSGMIPYISVIVDSFAGVFILGYFLAEKSSQKEEVILIAAGIVSFIFSCALIVKTQDYERYIFNNAPTMMLYASALFLLVKKYLPFQTESMKESLLVRLISKYSFSILLMHWGVLHFVVKQVLSVDVLSLGVVGGCFLMIILTLLISTAGAIIVDNSLVWLVHMISSRIGTILRHVFHFT